MRWLLCIALVAAPALGAQSPRWGLIAGGSVEYVPQEFSTKCAYNGDDNNFGVGGAAGLRYHASEWMSLDASWTHVTSPLALGCKDNFAFAQPGPGFYEQHIGFSYPKGTPAENIDRVGLTAAVETPPKYPLVRFVGGAGAIVAHPRLPTGTLGLGIGSRGERVRLSADVRWNVSRVRATDVTIRYTIDSAGVRTNLPEVQTPVVRYPKWMAVQFMVEFRLG